MTAPAFIKLEYLIILDSLEDVADSINEENRHLPGRLTASKALLFSENSRSEAM